MNALPIMPPVFRANGRPRDRRMQNRQVDADRGSASARGYDAAWSKAAKAHLRDDPLCRYCALDDQVTAAVLVDHLYPVRQYTGVFWREVYWVSCCADCHNGMKQRIERQGRAAIDTLARRLDLPTWQGEGGSKV